MDYMSYEDVIAIPLNKGATLFIDREVHEYFEEFEDKWIIQNNGYAIQTKWDKTLKKTITTLAHRLIWEYYEGKIPEGYELDHINQNKLDCRISNLRLATRSQNRMNTLFRKNKTSVYKGVSFYKSRGLWRAQIKLNGKVKTLGYFDTQEEAAKHYDLEAQKLFGEFACINGAESPFIEDV